MKEIKFIIEEDLSITVETSGFRGRVCTKELDKVRDLLSTITETKKSEYFIQEEVNLNGY